MNNIFKKIISIFILAMVLWSGVGFSYEKLNAQVAPNIVYGPDGTAKTRYGNAWISCNGDTACQNEVNLIMRAPEGSTPTATEIERARKEEAVTPGGTTTLDCSKFTGAEHDRCVILVAQAIDREKNQLDTTWFKKGAVAAISTIADGVTKTTLGVIAGVFQLMIVPVLSSFLDIVSGSLDLAMKYTLTSSNINSANIYNSILTIWALIRNILNITFIFILLYAAIRTILGTSTSETKKMIADVVIAALLINFSLFITRIVIDAGNILATNLYNLATMEGGSMTAVLMKMLGIGKLFATTGAGSIFSTEFFIITALQVFVILTAIITLGYILLMIIVRNVMLIFLMAMSPIGFMGDVIPKIQEYSKMWWDNLWGQVFIAPIFLLLFNLITLVGGVVGSATVLEGDKIYSTYFKFIMIIILLFVAAKITKKMSEVVGGMVENFGGMAVGAALGAVTGGAALLARQTIGRGATAALAGERGADLRARADSGSMLARMQLATLEKGSKSTYDARNVKSIGKATGAVGDMLGVKMPDVGKASGVYGKGTGFAGATAERQAAENQRYNEINKSITGKQRLAANEAMRTRDEVVKDRLNPLLDTPEANDYKAAKTEKERLLTVADTHKNLTNEQEALVQATTEKTRLDDLTNNITATGTPEQQQQHKKDLAEANRVLNSAKAKKEAKVKAIQEELKKEYKLELDQLDDTMKSIKTKVEKEVENDGGTLTADQKKQLDVVNRARNYADSVRQGRTGKFMFKSTAEKVAEGMETQRQ